MSDAHSESLEEEANLQTLPRDPLSSTDKSTNDRADDILWVDWDSEGDLENPKNWPYAKKWAATAVVSSFTFISPISSTMVAPATMQIAHEFGEKNPAIIAMMTSVFVLGYAFGPLLLGPLSEIYGRSRVLQLANLFYLAWNTGCGFARSPHQLIAFRLLAGLGGSAPFAIGAAVLADTWLPEERGRAISIYSLAPLLGPVLGPVCGGWLAERSTWRWVFWSTSIVAIAIQISGFFFLRETFAPYLLERKANRIRQSMDREKAQKYKRVQSVYDGQMDRSWKQIFGRALTRPYIMFTQEPIMQIFGIYMAFIYGLFYLYLTTLPTIFTKVYHEAVGITGLHYIALGGGLTLASQINARMMDKIYIYLKSKNGGKGEPEFRLPLMVPGSILVPFGLLLSGWSVEKGLHWISTDIGMACIGAGLILAFQSIQVYIVDSFTLYTASALAAVLTLRSLAGFGFPLFAPTMYEHLGYGKGDTILAAFAVAIGCPAPFLFWKYGRAIRMKSGYAKYSTTRAEVQEEVAQKGC